MDFGAGVSKFFEVGISDWKSIYVAVTSELACHELNARTRSGICNKL